MTLTEESLPPEAPGEKPAAPKMRIAIATPAYGNVVFTDYHRSIVALDRVFAPIVDAELVHLMRGGDSLITRVRNSMVAEFLADDSLTHLLWIDADIGFQPNDVIRLLNSGHAVCTGVYPLKGYTLPETLEAGSRDDLFMRHQRYPVNFDPTAQKVQEVDGFVEVMEAPTGFMLIRREVFLRLIRAYPQLKYQPDPQVGLPPELEARIADNHYAFFDTGIDPLTRRYLSEDYYFCHLLADIGVKIWASLDCSLTHMGTNRYRGNLRQTLRLRSQ